LATVKDLFARRILDWAVGWAGDSIDNFSNTVRRHAALGSKSPLAFELAHQIN